MPASDNTFKNEEIALEVDNDLTRKQVSRALNRTSTNTNRRPYIGKVEFKKVPGIDDVRPNSKNPKKVSTSKTSKVGKFSTDAAPTRFVIL